MKHCSKIFVFHQQIGLNAYYSPDVSGARIWHEKKRQCPSSQGTCTQITSPGRTLLNSKVILTI